MKLLILIACLLIERYLHIGNALKRFSWFEGYLAFLQKKFGKESALSQGFLGLVVAVFILTLPVIIFNILAVEHQYALSGAGLYFIILLYCFGPTDLYYQLYLYFDSAKEDKEHQLYSYNEIVYGETDEGELTETTINEHKLTETVFVRANCGVFGIVFWFAFGPLFLPVVYRALCLMSAMVHRGKEEVMPYAEVAPVLFDWLNWLPARVMAFLYVIAGGFQALSVWQKYVFTSVKHNQVVLIACGMKSLPKNKKLEPIEENKYAVALVQRAFGIFIAFLLIFSLGGWLS